MRKSAIRELQRLLQVLAPCFHAMPRRRDFHVDGNTVAAGLRITNASISRAIDGA